MSIGVVLVLMLFAHIVDDFYLQGILAKLKQKSWWNDNAPRLENMNKMRPLYEQDYIVALVIHAMSWAIMISLPILWAMAWSPHWAIYLILIVNTAFHAFIDDLKANKKKINLVMDQTVHIIQVLLTWMLWVFVR